LTIISHSAKVQWTQEGVRKYRSPYRRGTAVVVDFRPDAKLVYDSQYVPVF